eukprot:gb/GEZN01023592.1/.p1 GENE.gb/GEZN01023592.1/~~gb/GEZN01023592.1/.p1  ORF type:complete len:174 (-),score=41.37 gb/GEZN01023592.1/:14-535(-)
MAQATTTFNILGKTLKGKTNVAWALTKIYGVGVSEGMKICANLGLNPYTKLGALEKDMTVLQQYMEKHYKPEMQTKEEIFKPLRALVKMQCYRGIRAQQGLPTRGQKTRTNARTQRLLAPLRAKMAGIDFKPRESRGFSSSSSSSSLSSSMNFRGFEEMYEAGLRPLLWNTSV